MFRGLMMSTLPKPASLGRSLYEPALDGLRLVAFLSVFLHHLPAFPSSPTLLTFSQYGWVGVELFFVISSYLFFRLLEAEYAKKGCISARNFFIRRILRIYPLMILFTIAMMFWFGTFTSDAFLRLWGVAFFADNIIAWFKGYNTAIPTTAHLWTLSFEFQVYLLIPFAFLLWKRIGNARFLAVLATVYALCLATRLTVTYLGAPHPVVWVTPFLQPESVLIGIILAIGAFDRVPAWVFAGTFLVAGGLFTSHPPPWASTSAAAISYPLAAIMCVSLIETVRRTTILRAIFSLPVVVFLGTISFGLYVFHLFGIYSAQIIFTHLGWPLNVTEDFGIYWAYAAVAFAVTSALSAISYAGFEKPFLRLKDRFATVHGRVIDSSIPELQKEDQRSVAEAQP